MLSLATIYLCFTCFSLRFHDTLFLMRKSRCSYSKSHIGTQVIGWLGLEAPGCRPLLRDNEVVPIGLSRFVSFCNDMNLSPLPLCESTLYSLCGISCQPVPDAWDNLALSECIAPTTDCRGGSDLSVADMPRLHYVLLGNALTAHGTSHPLDLPITIDTLTIPLLEGTAKSILGQPTMGSYHPWVLWVLSGRGNYGGA